MSAWPSGRYTHSYTLDTNDLGACIIGADDNLFTITLLPRLVQKGLGTKLGFWDKIGDSLLDQFFSKRYNLN